MATKNDVQALIGGKIYTLSGYESNDYLQKVASYIDQKMNDLSQNDSYRHQSYDMRHILLELNLTDDYFKAKKQADSLQEDIEQRDREIYDLKHELIAAQLKNENLEKRIDKLKKELQEAQKKNVKLETELEKP